MLRDVKCLFVISIQYDPSEKLEITWPNFVELSGAYVGLLLVRDYMVRHFLSQFFWYSCQIYLLPDDLLLYVL